MTKRVLRAVAVAFALTLLGAAGAAAQILPAGPPPPPPPEAGVFFEKNVDIRIEGGVPDNMGIAFMTTPMAFDNETVIGAPYSADAITEVVQALADGNRIVRQSKAALARDSAGRTRREQGLSTLGTLVNAPFDTRHVQITDPEMHTIFLLDMQRRTAEKMPAPMVRVRTKMSEAGFTTGALAPPPPPPPPSSQGVGGIQMFDSAEARSPMPAPKVESLGKQFMEGVEAEGTRTTFTIPAGEIGNELPINIVSERWLSPELKVLVMSRQSDPRFGETTYRLTNISRSEPSPALFEVPSDFTVEMERSERDVIIKKMVK